MGLNTIMTKKEKFVWWAIIIIVSILVGTLTGTYLHLTR